MCKRLRIFGTLLTVALFMLTACEKEQEEFLASETSGATECETVQITETEQPTPREDGEQLFRRIDYALLGQSLYSSDYLQGYHLFDADKDGVEELFVDCLDENTQGTFFAFDFREDDTPFVIGHANRSASGISHLERMDNGVPILSSSYGSGGIGAQEVYMRWNGETWEEFAFYHVKMDYEAMQDSDEMIYSIRDIMYEREELEEEEFFSRIEALNLKPISRGLEELFGVTWSGMEMSAFVVGYQDHLSQLAPGETLCALGDVDGDGVEEVLWYVEDPFLPWRQNLAYQSRSYSLQPEQTEVYFSSANEGSLVLGNTEEDGIVITTMPAPVSGICGMRIENGEIVFDLNGNVQTKFAYAGIDAETGMFSLEERVSIYEAYLRTGEWYSFSPQDTFADIYHFSGDNKGYTTQRKTETGEDVDYGYNFQYAISSDGQRVIITVDNKEPSEYTLHLDTEYGVVLASDIGYDILPDGSKVPFQRFIWRYEVRPAAEQLLQDQLERKSVYIYD